MSSSQNPDSNLIRPTPPSSRPSAQIPSASEPTTPAETPMDQHRASALMMDSSSSASSSSDVTSPPPPNSIESDSPDVDDSPTELGSTHGHPIPPASEPMQYRAIGLVRGTYKPSEEQFTRGTLTTDDGNEFGAVLLGRVMSLVRKHVDLETPHLWVVYPRTRDKDEALHLQIVGVWEPETLNRSTAETDDAVEAADASEEPAEPVTAQAEEDEASETAPAASETPAAAPETGETDLQDGYFSIRGEVLFYSPENERLVVKIQQAPKKGASTPRVFKLNLHGKLEGKSIGYFWDFHVHRQNENLVMQEGTMIAMVPPKKKPAGASSGRRRPGGRPGGGPPRRPGGGGGGRRRWDGPQGGSSSGGDRPAAPSTRRDAPPPRPVKRPKPTTDAE